MISEAFYVLLLVFIGVALFALAWALFSSHNRKSRAKAGPLPGKPGGAGTCPLCETQLVNGAQIKSALFPGDKDRLCHIFGCPSCHPYPQPGIIRKCPVCHRKVAAEDYLIARLFDRPGMKSHVHILGCTNCRIGRKK